MPARGLLDLLDHLVELIGEFDLTQLPRSQQHVVHNIRLAVMEVIRRIDRDHRCSPPKPGAKP